MRLLSKAPPKFARLILLRFPDLDKDFALTDAIEEDYSVIRAEKGVFISYIWYWFHVITVLIQYSKLSLYKSLIMIKNYLKISIRNLMRHKGFSLITISGLTIGFAIFILSFLFSNILLNYDKRHNDSDRIYTVVQVKPSVEGDSKHTAITPSPLKTALADDFSEIESSVRFFKASRKVVGYENEHFYENGIIYADENFLSFFKNEMIAGDPLKALSEPYSIVMARSEAEQYFGSEDPVGKILNIDNSFDVTVTGVFEDISNFSGLQYKYIISMETANLAYDWMSDWQSDVQMTFVKIRENTDPETLEERFPQFLESYTAGHKDSPERMYLFPVSRLTFHAWDISTYWRKDVLLPVLVFYGMGIILLLIVCINFMNMSTARYASRAREIGVRKVIGAKRKQLAGQFIIESVIISFIALPAGVLVFELIRPVFIAFYDNMFVFSLWEHPEFLFTLFIMAMATGIISGLYPAVFLSSFKPVKVLKGTVSSGVKGTGVRKTLVVTQFVLSSLLIIMAVVIQDQHEYLRNVDQGYVRENVLYVSLSSEMRNNAELFNQEAAKHASVVETSYSDGLPGSWYTSRQVVPEGNESDDYIPMLVYEVSENFIGTVDMTIVRGRDFSEKTGNETSFIISESAAERLEWVDPIGKKLTYNNISGNIIGIAREFNFRYIPREKTPPVLCLQNENFNYSLIKINDREKEYEVAEYLKTVWTDLYAGIPFHYDTLDELDKRMNMGTEKGYQVTLAIGFITIFIASLGLFGLATFTIQSKIKEIGIRKALGASVPGIIKRFLRDFMKLVVISNIVACPVAYYLSRSFLDNMYFILSTEIDLLIFVYTALLCIFSAMIAVIFQVWRGAVQNPADTLKYE
ncbi:MAG: FtsX-like permease family protein [bacterium]|nr:FtsX-like permease family protein [bacterium]